MVALTLTGNLLTLLQPAILAALLANLTGAASQPMPPAASWFDLNYLGRGVSQWLQATSRLDVLAFLGILFLAASVLVAGLNYVSFLTAAWLRARACLSMQMDLVTSVIGQDMAFFARHKAGELMSRVSSDANSAAQVLGPLVLGLIHHTVQIAVYSTYLFSTSAWLTLGAFGLLLTQFGLTQALKRPIRRLVAHETDMSAGLLSALQEAFTSIRVAKSFGAEKFEVAKLRTAADAVAHALWSKSKVDRSEMPARSVLDAIAVLGIFLIAVVQMRNGNMTLEGLILFTFVGRLLITPINGLATVVLWVESMSAAAARLHELTNQTPSVVDGPGTKRGFERSIRIHRCSFAYAGRPALTDISLEIHKGEFVALVGPSGAGKSTLADLTLRLYDPDAGEISIDGIDLRTLQQRAYRRLFGVVSQETLLFHDTVRNNIRYGRDDISDEMIEQAARAANAHDFIVSLPQGYDTVVGDRGVRLSGGERQRVAIARAVVHNPQILVLDEATSALDSQSERLVQQAINRIAQQTTTIVIAHRLSTVMHADRIVLLNHGRIEAVGPHQQLLDSSPTYRRLCELQFDTSTPAATLT